MTIADYELHCGDLTPMQRKTLVALRDALTRGYLPAIKEVAAVTGHASHGHLLRTVDQLERAGILRRDVHRRWRSIQLNDVGTLKADGD